jgi:hypothetical protein
LMQQVQCIQRALDAVGEAPLSEMSA